MTAGIVIVLVLVFVAFLLDAEHRRRQRRGDDAWRLRRARLRARVQGYRVEADAAAERLRKQDREN